MWTQCEGNMQFNMRKLFPKTPGKKKWVVFVYIVVRSGSEQHQWKYQCKIMERFIFVCVCVSCEPVCWTYWMVREKTLQLQEDVCVCMKCNAYESNFMSIWFCCCCCCWKVVNKIEFLACRKFHTGARNLNYVYIKWALHWLCPQPVFVFVK